RIAVIGGGASGMFAATSAADAIQRYVNGDHTSLNDGYDVVVFEGTSRTMSKVRISGGGRVSDALCCFLCTSLPQILSSYPRGSKELRGLYTKRFTPNDAYDWFTSRGVQLKTESDGRMFPITDDSQTIIDVITRAAVKAGVELRIKEKVDSVQLISAQSGEEGFNVVISSKSSTSEKTTNDEHFDAIILATGSFPIGHEIARSLGHRIIKPVPSLFTFDAKELIQEGGVFHGLAGVSVPLARLTLRTKGNRKKKRTIVQEGPLLITHHGISGPATLRLSAFAAREFHAVGYKCEVKIHFCPKHEEEQREVLGCPLFMKEGREGDADANVPIIPKRLWAALVQNADIPPDTTWGDASKAMIRSMASSISSFSLNVSSKGIFKEEFVTAGGVSLKEVQMTNMQSKLVPGLFFSGECLDVDGVTGGFNFMGCWSTGFVAGEGAAEFCYENSSSEVPTAE
ncbi:hypothetical protein THAPSDRAFT_35087, partial [Thalassiosira pseudonana CCMP1335]